MTTDVCSRQLFDWLIVEDARFIILQECMNVGIFLFNIVTVRRTHYVKSKIVL